MEDENKTESTEEIEIVAEGASWKDPEPDPEKLLLNPEETPTAKLVEDYEALIGEINAMRQGHDAAELAYANRMTGAQSEAAHLLALVAKRLGWPLNGAPTIITPSGYLVVGRQVPRKAVSRKPPVYTGTGKAKRVSAAGLPAISRTIQGARSPAGPSPVDQLPQ